MSLTNILFILTIYIQLGSGLFDLPEGSILKKIFFYYVWPIKFLLGSIMPDPEKHPRLFPITFILCIICIGANSYLVSWMITLIGEFKLSTNFLCDKLISREQMNER